MNTKVMLLLPFDICFDKKSLEDLTRVWFSNFAGIICMLLQYEWLMLTARLFVNG